MKPKPAEKKTKTTKIPAPNPAVESERDLLHLSQTALLEERYAPKLIRITMLTLSIAIVCFLGWATITEVNEMARAKGDVVPDGYVQTVQHLEGGIISHILVEEGQLVKQGQALLRLNGEDSARDLQEMHAKERTLRLQSERLRAFIDGREPNFSHMKDVSPAMIRDQQRMFADMIDAREQESAVISTQIEQKQQVLAALQSRSTTLARTISLVREELTMQEDLLAKGLTSRLRAIDKRKELEAVSGEYASVQNNIKEARQSIGEYSTRLKSLNARHRDEAFRQLEAVDSSLAQEGEGLAKQQNRVRRLEVLAPVDGLVKGLEINTIGGVIAPGQPLMQIVPLNASLVVEAKISPKDIGHVRTGKPVQVKVHAFDYTRYGAVEGVLDFISATTFVDPQQNTYYRGRITLHKNYIGPDPDHNILVPGMTVDADIVTGQKTVLDYLLKPIKTAAYTAFTER